MPRKLPQPDVFRALADPTRRAILDQLRASERSVNEIADSFRLTQPAVSQHLRILLIVGLVRVRSAGRQRFYQLNAVLLKEVYDWVSHYETFWNERLDALGEYMEKNP